MTTTIFVEDSFDAAHFLPSVPLNHKCRNMHGHTYRLRLYARGPVDPERGWIVDYAKVKEAWGCSKNHLDHKIINDVKGLENPTCENIAAWILRRVSKIVPELFQVELRETEHCGAIVADA